jgi:hypothetical protein
MQTRHQAHAQIRVHLAAGHPVWATRSMAAPRPAAGWGNGGGRSDFGRQALHAATLGFCTREQEQIVDLDQNPPDINNY